MAEEATSTGSEPSAPSGEQSTPAGDLDAAIAKAVAMGDDAPADASEPAEPGSKGKGKPARRVEALAAKAVAAADKPAEPAAAPGVNEKALYHLRHGNVAKAIDAAFGDLSQLGQGLPDGVREALARSLGVGSKNWEQIRKYESRARRELVAKEQQVSQIVDAVKRDYAPFHQARSLFEAGDYDGALAAAFGVDSVEYQRKMISQRVGRDPEVERLKAELQRDREERQRERKQWEDSQRERSEQAQIADYKGRLQNELGSSDDPMIAHYAARPQFVHQVFEVMRSNYDPATNSTIPVHVAAEHVRDQIQASIQQWQLSHPGQTPVRSVQAAAMPAKPPVKPVRSLKQTGAAEATGAPVKLSSEDIRLKYQRMIEALPAEH
jgi:hypothetical protein